MPNRLPLSLALVRISTGAFLLIWALMKVLHPNMANGVAQNFYGFTLDSTIILAIGIAQVILVLAFTIGAFKFWTYGAVFLIHAASVASTWEKLINPYQSPNGLFWAAVPMVFVLLMLFLMRGSDQALTVRLR